MRHRLVLFACMLFGYLPVLARATEPQPWISLFDGRSLNGWKSDDETSNVFTVVGGAIQVKGGRAHLYYVGEVHRGTFKNFELNVKAMTTSGSNGGIYFHTAYQDKGWPVKGYECQINSSHSDKRMTGSLYGVQDVIGRAPSWDGEWFDLTIRVLDKLISIKVNGNEVVHYLEPENPPRPDTVKGWRLGEGTFAIQGHDRSSTTYLKDIMVRSLD